MILKYDKYNSFRTGKPHKTSDYMSALDVISCMINIYVQQPNVFTYTVDM
jgi:hypothetical protein